MNYIQALEVAQKIMNQSNLISIAKPVTTRRKAAIHPAFKEIKEDEFWNMGFDEIACMQDDYDVDCQVAQHCN